MFNKMSTTIKITTGIKLRFEAMSDLEVAVARIMYSGQSKRLLITSLISLTISATLSFLAILLFDENIIMVIVSSILFLMSIGGFW